MGGGKQEVGPGLGADSLPLPPMAHVSATDGMVKTIVLLSIFFMKGVSGPVLFCLHHKNSDLRFFEI